MFGGDQRPYYRNIHFYPVSISYPDIEVEHIESILCRTVRVVVATLYILAQ